MKFILMFYIMKITLIKCCKAPMRLWKSKLIQTFFLAGTFVTLVIVFVVHGLVVTKWVLTLSLLWEGGGEVDIKAI